jgi:shikimate kinase
LPGQGILLAGSSGAGKSALAAALAERLGLPAVDLDERIAAREGRSIPALFSGIGEAGFRVAEARALEPELGRPAVVALGGGAWETETVRRAAAESGFATLWLAERPEHCWSRAGGDPGRPLAASRALFMTRHRERIQRWSALPCVLPLGRTPQDLAEALVRALD